MLFAWFILSTAAGHYLAGSPLLDQLYGDLVHDNYKQPEFQQFAVSQQEEDSLGVYSTHEQKFPDVYYENILHHYMKRRTQARYPDKDDVSDIEMDQNMFGGIVTYAHLPHFNCFKDSSDEPIDVAIVGAPFDTGVSFRPGARFGPDAIRSNAKRLSYPSTIKNLNSKKKHVTVFDKSTHNYSIVDCGDVAMSPFDNRIALNQLYRGHRAIVNNHHGRVYQTPRVITMGGDHTITLMALRNLYEQWRKPIKVIHFDSHIDTWDPEKLGGGITNYMSLNHGTFLHYAHEKGFIGGKGNYHVGIRAPLIDADFDSRHDAECGFKVIAATAIDRIGVQGIIKELVGSYTLEDIESDTPVYISVDIDVLDPAYAPGTGTMEVGGFTSRELLAILEGLRGTELGRHLIGGDVVEVSPPYDSNSGITALAATAVIDSLLNVMIE
ncbi:hypothetical protein CANMA_001891 [Candida margitis]|uniref:uncharacterized protein n=1 Tax=Candida margitis TaxID=1775924 RepID=UPI002227BCB4|nr:uncharacterized protein CANMA_001891 [Candida margitis]KAI5969086.1 hypothetical protein CANMA_001891 [Candida margitis]